MERIEREDEQWLAARIGELASRELTARFGSIDWGRKADGSLITEADTAMQRAVISALAERFPQVPVLAEEQPREEQQRLIEGAENGVWCLDPLDGTTNFARGMPLFGVSLALIRHGRVEMGLVHDPVRRETFTARRGEGARLDGETLQLPAVSGELAESVAMVDFKRLAPPLATRLVVDPPFRSQRSIGSVALDWCWLAAGRFQLYLHGGQRIWDYAAGHLVAREAGAAVCLVDDVDGVCSFSLGLAPRMAIGAENKALLAAWRSWLSRVSTA